MEKNLEIKKLADIVVWADNLITAAGFDVEKYKNDATTAYCHVKAHELWKIKTVVLEAIDRHMVYANALNKDIADRDAIIEKLEKEIEGRKRAFNDLREEMANRYIPIETHNDICKTYGSEIEELEKELEDCKVKIKHQKENLDGINKTLEARTKEYRSLITVKNNQEKEIEAHEAENARLTERIMELKNQVEYLKKELNQTCACKELDFKGHQSREMTLVNTLADKNDEIKELKKEISTLDGIIKGYWDELKKKEDDHGREGFEKYIKYIISTEETKFKEELNRKFSEEVSKISRERTEEELAKMKGIPCGEDSIE